jgi:pimeloyl-ACP methyl ester carboxylesterase
MPNLELITRHPDQPNTLPPILFVHGAFCGAWIWDAKFLPYFAERGFTAHALSLRGHGNGGGHDRLPWYSLGNYVDDVAEIIAGLDTPPILVGHSMGGMVVQRTLTQHRDIPAAVLMASAPPHGLWCSTAGMALRHPQVYRQLMLLTSFGPDSADTGVIWRAQFSDRTPPDEIKKYESLVQQESKRVLMDMFGMSMFLPSRSTPVLVLGADRDVFFSPAEVRATARAYGTEPEIFPDFGHAMMLESCWQRVADRVIDWLDDGLSANRSNNIAN